MATFCERLQFLLKENPKIRRQDIITHTKITKDSMSRYFSGKTVPAPENLLKIAEFFSVSPNWLLGEDVPMKTNSTLAYGGSSPSKKDELISLIGETNLDDDKLDQIISIIKTFS